MDAINGLPAAAMNAATSVSDNNDTDSASKDDPKKFIKALAKILAGKNTSILAKNGSANMLPGLSAIDGSQEDSSSDLGDQDLSELTQKLSMLLKR